MGTNYYLKTQPPCPHCFRPYGDEGRGLHIGKSSAGWVFGLHVYPADEREILPGIESIEDLPDWLPLFEKYGVINEYGATCTPAYMIDVITERSHPNGLRRRTPGSAPYMTDRENGNCSKHGAGTWDLCPYEFS